MKNLYELFSEPIRNRLEIGNLNLLQFQEIRLRVAKGLSFCREGRQWWLSERGGIQETYKNCYVPTSEDMEIFLDSCSEHSLYAFAEQMRQGFLTIKGGHRVGFAGSVIVENDRITGFQEIGSVNLRIAHEIRGCAEEILPQLFENGRYCNTLIVSPPGKGKTTLLRDLIRCLSNGTRDFPGLQVAVADERGELAACYNGYPSFDLGNNTDVVDGGKKAEIIWMMLRSLGPQVIAMDEIGGETEAKGIQTAGHWGVGLLASIHGTMETKPWKQMGLEFERYIEPEMINGKWNYKVYGSAE